MNQSAMNPPAGASRVIVLGALSGIALATARKLAAGGAELALAARNAADLEEVAADLRLRGAKSVHVHALDLVAEPHKTAQLARMAEGLGGVDAVLLFFGVLGDQQAANDSAEEVRRIIDVNFLSAAEWVTASIAPLERSTAPRPVVVVASSVAGDRGRRSNYAYGAAKGGLSVFMQGLAHRLAAGGKVRAVVVKFGFVKTAMTEHLSPSGPLWAEPDVAAGAVLRAMTKGGPVVYAPWFWRWIMLAVRMTPAPIFNKVNL